MDSVQYFISIKNFDEKIISQIEAMERYSSHREGGTQRDHRDRFLLSYIIS